MDKAKKIGVWVAIVLLSVAFGLAGFFKLLGNEMMHASFLAMGLPVWFGYFIGAAEFAGAIGLYLRKTATWAGAGLAIIMVGAAYFHIAYAVPSAMPAIVLGVLAMIVAVARRKDALFLEGQTQAA